MANDLKKDVKAIGKPRIVKVDLYEEPHEATGEGFCKAPRLSFVECSCPDASVLGRQKKGGEAAGIDKCWWVVVLAFLVTTMESATSRCSGFLYVGIIEQMNVDRGLASWPVNLVTSVNDFGGLVSGPLSEHFSTVPVMAVGSVLASAGVIASAYAPDVTWISVSLGIVHVVDLALDKGVSMRDAVALIPYYSITDLVGRVFLPLLADRKYVRRTSLMMINYLFLGATVVSLPFTNSYGALVGASLSIAMFMGCGMTMHSVLMADYLGLERLAVGYSIMGAICGPLLMGKPPLVGFFRDNLGSYNAMFWLLGSLCIFIGLLWMMVSWFERKKVRNWELDIARNMPCTLHM
ncbi:monocarboxylate transporter 12-B-like isoform X2 [Rhipicephalus microplus]|uniref:monocarboxylate transporter 12-B-like isoform X2 n=1 Tax=Rhipicephalus microplus TaxID=6941 RepID=UPI003F6B30D2